MDKSADAGASACVITARTCSSSHLITCDCLFVVFFDAVASEASTHVIIIDVENEIGEKTPVEIDDTDDQNEAGACLLAADVASCDVTQVMCSRLACSG